MSRRGAAALAALASGAAGGSGGRARFEAAAARAARADADAAAPELGPGDALAAALAAVAGDVARGGGAAARTAGGLLEALARAEDGPRRKTLLRVFRWLAERRPAGFARALADALRDEGVDADAQLEGLLITRGAFGREAVAFKDLPQQKFVDACAADEGLLEAVAGIMAAAVDLTETSRFAGETPLAAAAADIFILCVLQLCRRVHARDLDASRREAALALWAQRENVRAQLTLAHEAATRGGATSSLFLQALQDLRDDVELVSKRETDAGNTSPYAAALAAHLLASGSALVHADLAWEDAETATKELSTCLAELNATTQKTQEISASESTSDTDERSFELDHVAKVQVRRLCLLVGRMSPALRSQVLEGCGADLLQLAVQQLGRKTSACATLASALVSTCLQCICEAPTGPGGCDAAKNADIDERVGRGYAPLFELLKADDAVATCAAEILAAGAAQYPNQLVPDLIGAAVSASAELASRVKALLALREYVALNHGELGPFTDVLRTRLLELVASDQLALRRTAGKVLGQVSPKHMVPYLCGLVGDSSLDAVSRSAASAALQEVFLHHEDTVEVFRAWFACAIDPAEVQGAGDVDEEGKLNAERINDSAKLWARVVPAHLWPSIFRVIWEEACARPEAAEPIGVGRRLAMPYFASHAIEVIAQDLLPHMQAQQELTEDILGDGAQEAAVRDLLFARLSPLLFLAMLPLDVMLEMESALTQDLAAALLQRIVAVYEFKEVRQVAAQALCRMDAAQTVFPAVMCGMEWFLSGAADPLKAQDSPVCDEAGRRAFTAWAQALKALAASPTNDAILPLDVTVAKALVFTAQQVVARDPGGGVPRRLVEELLQAFGMPCRSPDSPLASLQEGCIHVLSQLAIGSLESWNAACADKLPLVQELGATEATSEESASALRTGPAVYDLIVERAFGGAAAAGALICMSNVVLATLRGMTSIKDHAETEPMILEATSESRLLRPACLAARRSMAHAGGLGQVVAAQIQVVFAACLMRSKSHERGAPTATVTQQMSGLVLEGLADARTEVRSSSVNLAGALLTLPPSSGLPDGAMAALVQKLSGLANMDADPEVRAIAGKLAQQL